MTNTFSNHPINTIKSSCILRIHRKSPATMNVITTILANSLKLNRHVFDQELEVAQRVRERLLLYKQILSLMNRIYCVIRYSNIKFNSTSYYCFISQKYCPSHLCLVLQCLTDRNRNLPCVSWLRQMTGGQM